MSRWTAILARLKRLPNPVKIIGGLGALVGLILGVIQLYQVIFPPPKPAQRSVLFIVDSSVAMRRHFGAGQTKFQAVKSEILRYVRNQPDVLVGLRFVGSVCPGPGYQPPAVTFDTHNEQEIARSLNQVRPTSLADLSGAVGQGANDFLRYDAAGKAASPSMWVFFGSTNDQCGVNGLANEIATALHDVKVDARFDFFVLGKSAAGHRELDRLLSKLHKQGHTAFWLRPRNQTQLHHAVELVSRSEMPSVR